MKKYLWSIISIFTILLILSASFNIVFAYSVNGWKKQDGKWYYYNENGEMYSNDKYRIGDKYYLFDKNGKMIDTYGWYKSEYTLTFGGNKHTVYEWNFINTDGSLQIGWRIIGDTWYYFDVTGKMISDCSYYINGKTYVFEKSGAMVTNIGWYSIKYNTDYVEWYYLKSDNTATVGWKLIGNIWYYFDMIGIMVDSPTIINNETYCFKKTGEWIKPKGWYKTNSFERKKSRMLVIL